MDKKESYLAVIMIKEPKTENRNYFKKVSAQSNPNKIGL